MVIWRFRIATQRRKLLAIELGIIEVEAIVGRGHGRKGIKRESGENQK